MEHPYSNHVGNVLISAWLDLFSPAAVTWRQQLWICENSQTVSCLLLLFWGVPLWLKNHRDFISARVFPLIHSHLSQATSVVAAGTTLRGWPCIFLCHVYQVYQLPKACG